MYCPGERSVRIREVEGSNPFESTSPMESWIPWGPLLSGNFGRIGSALVVPTIKNLLGRNLYARL